MSPPRTNPGAATPPHLKPGRRASWFELFFDLAFVTALAQLTGALSGHFDAAGFAKFTFGLLLLWWTWLGHTFHSTRFDEDRFDQHLLGMAKIAAVLVIGYGAGAAYGERALAFALGMAALKGLLLLAYLRERQRPAAAGLVRTYGLVYGAQVVLWLSSAPLAGPAQWACWAGVLLLDMVTPALVARHTHGYPPHPEHLPERFGLFTIIVMGESVASALHALLHDRPMTAASLGLAALGLALGFCWWMGYFERVGGQSERHVKDSEGGRRLRRWAYGHIPLLIGIGGSAAALVATAGHHAGPQAPWVAGGCISLAMLGLTVIARAQPHGQRSDSAWPYTALALLPLLAGAGGSMRGVFVAGIATAMAQLWMARQRHGTPD